MPTDAFGEPQLTEAPRAGAGGRDPRTLGSHATSGRMPRNSTGLPCRSCVIAVLIVRSTPGSSGTRRGRPEPPPDTEPPTLTSEAVRKSTFRPSTASNSSFSFAMSRSRFSVSVSPEKSMTNSPEPGSASARRTPESSEDRGVVTLRSSHERCRDRGVTVRKAPQHGLAPQPREQSPRARFLRRLGDRGSRAPLSQLL